MAYPIKKLTNTQISKLQALETKLDSCILVVESDHRGPKLAKLDAEQLAQLQTAEKDMDAIFVAYKC